MEIKFKVFELTEFGAIINVSFDDDQSFNTAYEAAQALDNARYQHGQFIILPVYIK